MNSISVQELKKMIDKNEEFQLIDIRESHEVQVCEIGGEHIPMGEVMSNLERIRKDIPVIIHCRSGKRALAIAEALEKMRGYTNLSNLEGGIIAWAKEIDTSLEIY